jgi:hypothetical protein
VPMLTGTVAFSALIIDISYGFFDPRVCHTQGRHRPRWAPSERGPGARQDRCMTHLAVIE